MQRTPHILWILALTLLSCHQYPFMADVGYNQASWNNEVDILFVTDNSESMESENSALTANFSHFMDDLREAETTLDSIPQDDLSGSVEAALYYVGNYTRFIEYQVAMTTTEVLSTPTLKGQSGSLVLDEVLTTATEDIEGKFEDMIDWVTYHPATTGEEKGLDALRLTICKGHNDPTSLDERTRSDLKVGCSDVSPSYFGETSDLFRDGATLAIVIVTDEGDFSNFYGADGVSDTEDDLSVDDFIDFFDAAGIRVVASVIGPTIPEEGEDGILCNPSSSPYRLIRRYADLVEKTGGILEPICDPNNPTEPNPSFAVALGDIGALISGLQNRFELAQAPDVSSIIVVVNDSLMPQDQENGWAYIQSQGRHFVEFRGTAIPGFEATVNVYFHPLAPSGGDDPRQLPF